MNELKEKFLLREVMQIMRDNQVSMDLFPEIKRGGATYYITPEVNVPNIAQEVIDLIQRHYERNGGDDPNEGWEPAKSL